MWHVQGNILAVSVQRDRWDESFPVCPSYGCVCVSVILQHVSKVVSLPGCPSVSASIRARTARSWCKPQSSSSTTCSHVRSLEALLTSQAVSAFLPTACTGQRFASSLSHPHRRTPPWVPRRGTCRSTGRPQMCWYRCHISSGWPRRGVWGRLRVAPCPDASASHPQNRCLSRAACSPAWCSWWWVSAPGP